MKNYIVHCRKKNLVKNKYISKYKFNLKYQFTPFGTWLHNRLRTNKGKVDLEAKTEEFDIDNFENEDITSYSDIYNINYHSARNS